MKIIERERTSPKGDHVPLEAPELVFKRLGLALDNSTWCMKDRQACDGQVCKTTKNGLVQAGLPYWQSPTQTPRMLRMTPTIRQGKIQTSAVNQQIYMVQGISDGVCPNRSGLSQSYLHGPSSEFSDQVGQSCSAKSSLTPCRVIIETNHVTTNQPYPCQH